MNKPEEGPLNAIALAVTETFHVPIRADGSKVEVCIARDRRTMNNMDPETKAVHIRLEQWGAETRESLHGYPPVTMLGRLIEQGPMGAAQTGKPPVALSDAAARVDACVAKLCQIDQRALRAYYQGWMTVYELSRKLSMRERQAQNVLRRARWRLGAHLSAME
jgi:hypothetical protein